MKWFKNLWLGSKERNKLIEKIKELEVKSYIPTEVKSIYKNRTKLGDITLCILENGEVLNIDDKDDVIYNKIPLLNSLEELKSLFIPEIDKEEIDKEEIVIKRTDLAIFAGDENFEVRGEEVYLKDISWRLPNEIVAEFIEILENKLAARTRFKYSLSDYHDANIDEEFLNDKYNRLYYFTLKLAYSPIANKENILLFCRKNDIRLTKTGNIITYRRFNKWNIGNILNKELQDYVDKEFNRIKLNKKSPANYKVWQNLDNSEYITCKYSSDKKRNPEFEWKYIGNLAKLKAEGTIEDKEEYLTSQHNPGKYIVTYHSLYSLNKNEEPNPDLKNCASNGLHTSSVQYDYSGFGNIPVICLVNPSKAIYVPQNDFGKFRTSEMWICCKNPNEEGIHIDEELIEEDDLLYNDHSINELKEVLKNKSFEKLSAMEYTPETSLKDIKEIIGLLENRVVNI